MRKYLATIVGVAVGITAAILVAARADDDAQRGPDLDNDRQKGGA